MREHLDGQSLANYLRMLRTSADHLFLVVEGDSDVRALEPHIDKSRCTIIGGYGKQSVLDAIQEVTLSDPDGVVALVDRDFDPWLHEELRPNVFHTVLYDLAADLLLMSGLLERYVDASIDVSKAAAKLPSRSTSGSIVNMIVEIAESVGKLRWVSLYNGLKLNLRDFPISTILDEAAKVVIDDMIRISTKRSGSCEYEPLFIRAKFDFPASFEQKDFCSGHDLTNAVVATQNRWSRSQISRSNLHDFTIMSLRSDLLHEFRWFHQMLEWADEHGRVLWIQ